MLKLWLYGMVFYLAICTPNVAWNWVLPLFVSAFILEFVLVIINAYLKAKTDVEADKRRKELLDDLDKCLVKLKTK